MRVPHKWPTTAYPGQNSPDLRNPNQRLLDPRPDISTSLLAVERDVRDIHATTQTLGRAL